MLKTQGHKITLIVIFLITFFGFLSKINLTNSDIGRHLKNGETILKDTRVLSTNYYSYTNPEFGVINHHWLTGLIFYAIWNIGGYSSLSIISAIIMGLSLVVLSLSNINKSNFKLVLLITLFALPFLMTRKEIRPETISYFFIALYLGTYSKYEKDGDKKILFIIPILQLLWINIHIFFIFGYFIIGLFLLKELLNKKRIKQIKTLCAIGIISLIAGLINPAFIKGLLIPLTLMQNFGYMLAENQSILFMHKRNPQPIYIYYIITLIVLIQIMYFTITRTNFKNYIVEILLLVTFAILGFQAIRLLPLYSIAIIYSIPTILYDKFPKDSKDNKILWLAGILIICSIFIPNQFFSISNQMSGVGLTYNNLGAKNFWDENGLKGPVFNNYDIGGYLIHTLPQGEKVFVDNRPEAYPEEFFRDKYIPMQNKNDIWYAQENVYNFNAIYFYRHDLTPWGQNMLIKRFQDPTWIPVYVDEYTIIFLKDNEQNKELIQKFRLPDELFRVSKG